MADTAFQRQYRQEFIAGFEKRQSLVRHTVITETEIRGNEAVFLVADSGGATAVTRGVNGDIPTRPDNLNQFTATLQEWHDVPAPGKAPSTIQLTPYQENARSLPTPSKGFILM